MYYTLITQEEKEKLYPTIQINDIVGNNLIFESIPLHIIYCVHIDNIISLYDKP